MNNLERLVLLPWLVLLTGLFFFVLFVPLCGQFQCTIAANVKSKNRDTRRRLRRAFYCA